MAQKTTLHTYGGPGKTRSFSAKSSVTLFCWRFTEGSNFSSDNDGMAFVYNHSTGQMDPAATLTGDHGAMTGLGDDDHTQYHNDTRGDARYTQRANNLSDLNNASTARTNLGVAIGSDVQAYSSNLDVISGLTPTLDNFMVGTGSSWGQETPAQVRTSLDVYSTGEVDTSLAGKQDAADNLTDVAGLATTDGNIIVGNGTNFIAESGATARTSLGLGTADSPTFTNMVSNGNIKIKDGTFHMILDSVGPTADRSHEFQDYAGIVPTVSGATIADGSFIVADGTKYIEESGATARTSLGLGTGDNVEFTGVDATGTMEIPHVASDPVSPVAGQIWINTTAGELRFET